MTLDLLDATEQGIPPGRARWRLMVRRRDYANDAARPAGYEVADLSEARSRRLSRALNKPAQLTFSVPGDSAAAYEIRELSHEVVAYRAREFRGAVSGLNTVDEVMGRFVVTSSQDHVSEQVHTTNFVCTDYLGMIGRRMLTRPADYVDIDQDVIASGLLDRAQVGHTSAQPGFPQAARLGLIYSRVLPDGSPRSVNSGRVRVRRYGAQSNIGDLLAQLGAVIDGFDFDVRPGQYQIEGERLRVFYPYQGEIRDGEGDFAFVYGSTVSSLTRSVNANNFANYVRVIGQADGDNPPPFAEAWDPGTNDVVTNPEGLWQEGASFADVAEVATLAEKAAGLLTELNPLVPSYSLSLRPTAYQTIGFGSRVGEPPFSIGDTCRLRVRRGRLDEDTWVRVEGVTFVIGDDGEEDVDVDVGPVLPTFSDLVRGGPDRRLSALERR